MTNQEITLKEAVTILIRTDLNAFATVLSSTGLATEDLVIEKLIEASTNSNEIQFSLRMISNFPPQIIQSIRKNGFRATCENTTAPMGMLMIMAAVLNKITLNMEAVLDSLKKDVRDRLMKIDPEFVVMIDAIHEEKCPCCSGMEANKDFLDSLGIQPAKDEE